MSLFLVEFRREFKKNKIMRSLARETDERMASMEYVIYMVLALYLPLSLSLSHSDYIRFTAIRRYH